MIHQHNQVLIVGAGPVGVLLSKLLRRYGLQCKVLEKRLGLRHHPQAHYINGRTMEILRSLCWEDYVRAVAATPPSITWRDFVYCHSVASERPFLREDQFARTDPSFWQISPSSNIHLAQSVFEEILLTSPPPSSSSSSSSNTNTNTTSTNAIDSLADKSVYFGHELQNITLEKDRVVATVRQSDGNLLSLTTDYLIGCDGAHSKVRSLLGIETLGEHKLQHLMNVHFYCDQLRQRLPSRTAMLYFLFHQQRVVVYVSHDPVKDEWICQIPYFPPFESSHDFTESRVRAILEATLFDTSREGNGGGRLKIDIRAIHHWVMHAEVAEHYVDPRYHRVYLAGDAAHKFPPAGGFGMNTGIQDAHNLAWKLARTVHGQAKQSWLANSYEKERQKVAKDNTAFALRNYAKSAAAAQALGVDPAYAEVARKIAQDTTVLSYLLPEKIRKQAFLSAMDLGLQSLQLLQKWWANVYGRLRVQALQKLSDEGKTLPLIFPDQDLGFSYSTGTGPWQEGRRLEHFWLLLTPPVPTAIAGLGGSSSSSVDAEVVVSSIDLPAIAQRVASRQDKDATSASPPVVILVKDVAAARLLPQVEKGLECLPPRSYLFLHLHPAQAEHYQTTASLLGVSTDLDRLRQHSTLQSHLQIPHFLPHLSETATPSKAQLEQCREEELHNIQGENSRRLSVLLSEDTEPAYQRFHSLLSITGERREMRGRLLSGELAAMPRLVAVRPDGHIAASLPLRQEDGEEQVKAFCQTLASSLGLPLGGAGSR